MRRAPVLLCASALLLFSASASAQQQNVRQTGHTTIDSIRGTPNYDVVLEVPNLSVDSIVLRVDGVRVQVAADVQAANLVSLNAGALVGIDTVSLTVAGVAAEAYLYVDLDNVSRIVNRVVQTLDRNPEIVTTLLSVVDTTVNTVGGLANTAFKPGGVVSQAVGVVGQTLNNVTAPNGLLSQTVNTLGQTVQTVLSPTGSIVERTLSSANKILDLKTVGSLTSLPVLKETAGTAGAVVRQVRDQAGNLIQYTLGQGGKVSAVRLLQKAAGAAR